MNIHQQLKAARIAKGISQSQLGKKLNLFQSHISYYENGKRDFSLKRLKKLAKGLGKKVVITLIDEKEETKAPTKDQNRAGTPLGSD